MESEILPRRAAVLVSIMRASRHSLGILILGLGAFACTHPGQKPVHPDPPLLKPSKGIRGIFEDRQGNIYFTSTEWTAKYEPPTHAGEVGRYHYLTQDLGGVLLSGF